MRSCLSHTPQTAAKCKESRALQQRAAAKQDSSKKGFVAMRGDAGPYMLEVTGADGLIHAIVLLSCPVSRLRAMS